MLTVACVWVKANVPYSMDYVLRLQAMVARHLPVPHRFVCFTDRAELLPSHISTVAVKLEPGISGWWAKVMLFSPVLALQFNATRALYLDLDSVVVDSLHPIVEYPAPFALVPHAGTFNGRNGLAVVKRFNSSVMVWDPLDASALRLFSDFDASVPQRLWGDQDWIGERYPTAATMPAEWFPRISQIAGQPDEDAIVVLCKKPKNEIAAKQHAWVRDAWRAA